jgi:hypothetical protein
MKRHSKRKPMRNNASNIKPLFQETGGMMPVTPARKMNGKRSLDSPSGSRSPKAHTNVVDPLAQRSPQGKAQALFKLEIFVPQAQVERIIAELGAGNNDYVASYHEVHRWWMPLEGANPCDGEVGKISRTLDYKLEIRCQGKYVRRILRRLKEIHPYEKPLINIIRLDNGLFDCL